MEGGERGAAVSQAAAGARVLRAQDGLRLRRGTIAWEGGDEEQLPTRRRAVQVVGVPLPRSSGTLRAMPHAWMRGAKPARPRTHHLAVLERDVN